MRELSVDISLISGLTPEKYRQLNVPELSRAVNLIARGTLLEPLPAINPLGSIAVSWPFPQVFRSTAGNLLFDELAVSVLDTAWSPTALVIRDPAAKDGAPITITTGTPWHFADFHGDWYATNGKTLLWTSALAGWHGESNNLFGSNAIPINTITNFRGICVFGGFNPATVWGANIDSMFATWLTYQTAPEEWIKDPSDLDNNWVMWSSIGGGDFPQWLLFPQGYGYDLTPTADDFLDQAQRNEFGWIPMSWRGPVYRILPLGKAVIVYGEQGVTAMPYHTGVQLNSTGPTFGIQDLLLEGVRNGNCCAGDERIHIFIDNYAELWTINADLQLQRLGYKHHLDRLNLDNTVITQDPLRGAFYISDGVVTFVLGSGGLTEATNIPSSLFRLGGDLYGTYLAGDTSIEVGTGAFDLNHRGMKTITQIQVPVWDWKSTKVRVDYTYDGSGYKTTEWYPVSPEGVAFIRIAGVSFRVIVKYDATAGPVDVSRITVSFQQSDKRYRRGPDANSIAT